MQNLNAKDITAVTGGTCCKMLALGTLGAISFAASFYLAAWLRTFRRDKNVLCNPIMVPMVVDIPPNALPKSEKDDL